MTKVVFHSSTINEGNMSFRRGDPAEALKNRLNFLSKHHLDFEQLVVMSPTHTTNIKTVTLFDKKKTLDETDGIITNDQSITLFTLTGDCIPLGLVDPIKKVFALIHISWMNADKGILTEAISAFIYNFHTAPKNLAAKIGPSIGPCCYHQKNPSQLKNKKWQPFIKPIDGVYSINLWGFIEQELRTLGILKKNIENPQLCTYHSGKYFSHHKVIKEKLKHDFRLGTLLTIK